MCNTRPLMCNLILHHCPSFASKYEDSGRLTLMTDTIADFNRKIAIQNKEIEKRAAELLIANEELAFQNEEKGKRATELIIADKELAFQNEEKGKRAAELIKI